MNVYKQSGLSVQDEGGKTSPGLDNGHLEAINRLSKAPLQDHEVYTFAMHLCDNEVDRDGESFDVLALHQLATLFLGKSGGFDHDWSARGQTARIYATEVVVDESASSTGEAYTYLKAWAYLLRREENEALIAAIDGGIQKEVSVGCAIGRRECSICGSDDGCDHQVGQHYGGRLCFQRLLEAKDAYEWSFVAVPSQVRAGVVKGARRSAEEDLSQLRKEAALGKRYLRELRQDVSRLLLLSHGDTSGEVLCKMCQKLDEEELRTLQQLYSQEVAKAYPPVVQLAHGRRDEGKAISEAFLV